MNTSKSFQALREANPRYRAGFTRSVQAAADAVEAQILATAVPQPRLARPRRRLVRTSAACATLAVGAAAAAAFLTIGSPGGGPGVEDASAAFRQAAQVTAAAAERSGTAVVRITHDGEPWAGSTIRWGGTDLAVASDFPRRPGEARSELRLVAGTLYGFDPSEGGWVALGSPASIDPGSGTTPDEYLAAVREDVGGRTLRMIMGSVTGLETSRAGGSTVYRGSVAAGLIARKSGVKGDRAIRLLPFGYVAHDEAADPAAALDVAVTVGAGGIIRELAVSWGAAASAWTYTVTYSGLGATPGPVAPENARPLTRR